MYFLGLSLSLLLGVKSYTTTRKQRLRYENNWALGINGQGPMPGSMKKKDNPQAVTKVQTMRQQAEQASYPDILLRRRFRQRQVEKEHKVERQQWEWKAWTRSPSWSSPASSSTQWQGSSTWWASQKREAVLFF